MPKERRQTLRGSFLRVTIPLIFLTVIGVFGVIELMTHRSAVLRLNGRRPLFCTLRGGAVRPSYVRSLLKRLAARAGIERRVHPHALRHTMAAELLREGASVRHIQLQLGHSDLSTTAAYLESIQPLELVEMARSRPPWNGRASGRSGGA